MSQRKKERTDSKSSSLSKEAKAAKLQEILARAARRNHEDAQQADAEQKVKDRLDQADDDEERDLLNKIQRTYEKYLDKKSKKAPRVSKKFKDEVQKKEVQHGNVDWRYVTYEDLDLLDLNQESSKTGGLFVINLIMMVLALFIFVGICAITAIVTYAGDEIDQLHDMPSVDSSIFMHNLFQFLTLMPTVMILLQVLINVAIIL